MTSSTDPEPAPKPRPEGSLETETTLCAVCGGDAATPVGRGVDFEYATSDDEFEYVACNGCGHVYLRNRPVEAELSRIYPASYGNYDAARGKALTFRVKSWLDARSVRRLAGLAARVESVLDVGCADGRLLDVCRQAVPDAHLFGVEISDDAARAARDKGYDVRIGTVDHLDLPEDAYDLVFLQQVIEHVYDPAGVCEKLARSLRPGGLVVLETPTVDSIDFKLFKRRYWGGYHMPRHFNLFSEASLLTLCERAGLEHVETTYTPQPIHWVWSLHHYLQDKGFPRAIYRHLDIRNAPSIAAATLVEIGAGAITRKMSNLRLVVRRPAS